MRLSLTSLKGLTIDEKTGTKIAEFIREVLPGEENTISIAKDTDDETGSKVTTIALQNRKLQPEPPAPPQKAESPRRAHSFHDIAGFCDYLKKYKTKDTVVLADVEACKMQAIMDESRSTGFEIVTLTPAIHPMFQPWKGVLGRPLEITSFAEFIMQNRRQIFEPDGREMALLFSQVRASTTMTVNRGVGRRSINGVMIETVIQGDRKNELVELPDSITIQVPLFVSTKPQNIEIDLLVLARGEGLTVTASSALVLDAMTASFMEMLDEVKFLDGVVCSTGKAAHEPWKYL